MRSPWPTSSTACWRSAATRAGPSCERSATGARALCSTCARCFSSRPSLSATSRRRVVYVGLTRAKDELFVTATREEQSSAEVEIGDHDHFAEILSWALANSAKASVVEAEQLQLPALEAANGTAPTALHVALDVLDQFELVRPKPSASVTAPDAELELSFSQLHDYEICPVRYRFSQVWGVP